MSNIPSPGLFGYKSLVLTLAAAVATSAAGLFAITIAPAQWSPPGAAPVKAVDVAPWHPESGGTSFPFLDGPNPSTSHGAVEGTGPASLTGTSLKTTSGTDLVVRPASFGSVPMAPVPANDKGSGDFTGLPGASSGAWGVTGQTGSFTWSYPFSARQAPAGPSPSLALAYDSSAVDGLTSATNNQASVVGDGWSLAGVGSISQKFTPCMDQGVSGSYDLCGSPTGQQFSISFGGRSGAVIKDAATGAFRLQNDDNTKVEYLTDAGSNGTYDGGYWKLTDTSGTQYFFGRNHLTGWATGKASTNSTNTVPVGAANASQPCAAGTFAASLCQQAYAWNLDYVLDVQGNSQALYYTQDTNNYAAQAGTGARLSYVRASRLAHIDYGMRTGTELDSPAPLRIDLAYTGRCTGVDCSVGNDIPTSFACAPTGACTVYSPTFYTDQRLLTVTTRTATSPTAYQDVDVWTLHHSMPDPGDLTKPALWLGSIDHGGANTATGVGGAISDPPVVFSGQTLQNRVWVADGLAPLDRYRISTIKTTTGATIAVTYQAPECSPNNLPASPETNTKRCFPQWWAPTTPIAQPARMDYFHVYPVASVATQAGPGGAGSPDMLTRYEYQGTPSWKYAGPKYVAGAGGSQLTWSVMAGWAKVKTIAGNAGAGQNPSTIATYLLGMDGTPSNGSGGTIASTVTLSDGTAVPDSPWLAGSTVETEKFLGETGARLSTAITVPWSSAPTATGSAGTVAAQARHLGTKTQKKVLASSIAGGTRTTSTTNYFDGLGRITSISDAGETGGSTGTCTVTAYADNTGANLLALPATTSTYAGPCTTAGAPAGNILKANRTIYDASTSAIPGSSGYQAPTLGNIARTDVATVVSGTTVTSWQIGPSIAYDSLGRSVSSTDSSTGTARTTSVAYMPAIGLPTSTTTTNPLGWTKTIAFEAVRGSKVTSTDENGNASSYRYDASGRITGIWDPMRPQATNPVPTEATSYTISQTAPSSILHTSINGTGEAMNSYDIYDGLGRIRQTQRLSPGGGTIATDTYYNTTGAKRLVNNDYYYATNPDGTLMVPNVAVPSSTQYDYDGAGRVLSVTALAMDNQTLWSTQTAYTGEDTSTVTGTATDAATTTVVNSKGKITSRLLYHGPTAAGTPDTTAYGYDALEQMTSMTDTAGNQWNWTFDPAGRKVSATDPDTGVLTTSYDSSGRTATSTDSLGTVTAYVYDALDRKSSVTVTPAGGTVHTLQSSTYDAEKKGQLSSATRYNGVNYDQAITTAVSGYNAAYLPRTTTLTLPASVTGYAGSYTTTRTYTKTGNISAQVNPAIGGLPSETLYFGYDSFEHPSSIATSTSDTIAGATQYNHLGQIAGFQQYDKNVNSSTVDTTGLIDNSFSWDATTGRLANQSATNTARGVTSDLGKISYTYTPSGKLSARELAYAQRPGTPDDYQCYNYDYASRLAAVWTPAAKNCSSVPAPSVTSVSGLGGPAPYAETYAYTSAGDRSQVKRFDANGTLAATENYSYPTAGQPGAHRLQSMTSIPSTGTAITSSFTWDAAGRMTGRAGETLTYSLDGRISTTTGSSNLKANPNPSAAAGTPPAPTTGTAGSTSTRYYDATGLLVAHTDGSGTTAVIGSVTAHATTSGVKTATRTYTYSGKTVAQRTAADGVVKLTFVLSDTVNTTQTMVQPTNGANSVTAITRFIDPSGLARGSTQSATGTGAYSTAPSAATGVGSNAANPAGFGAVNGYLSGLSDSISALTHLGARDYDPVLGIFTAPDPVLNLAEAKNFSPYLYSEGDPINSSDPSGLYRQQMMSDSDTGGGPVRSSPVAAPSPAPLPVPLVFQGAPSSPALVWGVSALQQQVVAWAVRTFANQPTAAISDWALGRSQPKGPVVYSDRGEYVDAIKRMPGTIEARARLMDQLRNGSTSGDAGGNYQAGKPDMKNPNFLLDVCTFATWETGCGGLRPRAITALGSYELTVRISEADPNSKTAVLQYQAQNDMTLGSAIGPTQLAREWLNKQPMPYGPLSKQEQIIKWTESVRW